MEDIYGILLSCMFILQGEAESALWVDGPCTSELMLGICERSSTKVLATTTTSAPPTRRTF
jgi:hypothetical protein